MPFKAGFVKEAHPLSKHARNSAPTEQWKWNVFLGFGAALELAWLEFCIGKLVAESAATGQGQSTDCLVHR
jgi:hypothetical protein